MIRLTSLMDAQEHNSCMFEMVKKGAFVQHIDKELGDLLLDLIILQFVSIKFIRLDGFGEVYVMASSMSSSTTAI